MKKLKFWQRVIISMSGQKFKEKYVATLLLKVALEGFIKNGEKAVYFTGAGLCHYVNKFSRDFVRESELKNHVSPNLIANLSEGLFRQIYKWWPVYSGDFYYPVHDKFETYILEDYMSSILCPNKKSQEVYIGPVSPKWQYLLNSKPNIALRDLDQSKLTKCSGVDGLYKGRQLELRLDLAKFVHGRL